jgi:hypothetical protein
VELKAAQVVEISNEMDAIVDYYDITCYSILHGLDLLLCLQNWLKSDKERTSNSRTFIGLITCSSSAFARVYDMAVRADFH